MNSFDIKLEFHSKDISKAQENISLKILNNIETDDVDDSEIPTFGNSNVKLPDTPAYLLPLINKYKNFFRITPGTTNKIAHKIDT